MNKLAKNIAFTATIIAVIAIAAYSIGKIAQKEEAEPQVVKTVQAKTGVKEVNDSVDLLFEAAAQKRHTTNSACFNEIFPKVIESYHGDFYKASEQIIELCNGRPQM